MEFLTALFFLVCALGYASYRVYVKPYPVEELEEPVDTPPEPVKPPVEPPKPPLDVAVPLDFSTPPRAFKSTRILCDEFGLSYDEKNLICAVIFHESGFNNKATNKNPNSTDWGICQINDKWHIGPLKTFPSIQYVLDNPEKIVRWMIKQYKAGNLEWWIAYKSGAYLAHLKPESRMWKLRVDNPK
jgi:hypothetical protein